MNCKHIDIETLRIQIAKDYPIDTWIHEVVNPNGGYVVIHKERHEKGLKNSNEKEVYHKELVACKVAAAIGHRVVYLNDGHKGGTFDILLDNIPTDLKKTTSHNNDCKACTKGK